MSINKRYTAIVLVNELHFLALEQSKAVWNGKETLPIMRLAGTKVKQSECTEIMDLEPYESCRENLVMQYEINYNFLDPEHGVLDLSKYAKTWERRQVDYLPLKYMQIQLDLYPETKYVYRLDFYHRRIPENSETLRQREAILEKYLQDNDLYLNTDPRQLAKPYCLELNRITKGPRTSSNAAWKNPEDVTNKYLKVSGNETEDFFPLLDNRVGGVIRWAYKYYNDASVGWQLDGMVSLNQIGAPSR